MDSARFALLVPYTAVTIALTASMWLVVYGFVVFVRRTVGRRNVRRVLAGVPLVWLGGFTLLFLGQLGTWFMGGDVIDSNILIGWYIYVLFLWPFVIVLASVEFAFNVLRHAFWT